MILDQYSELVEAFIQHQTILAPLLLLLVEEAGVPLFVPGDAVLAYAGYTIESTHQSSLPAAFLVAVSAVVIGATILFYLSRRYGRLLVLKFGGYMYLDENHLHRAERLFKRYGVWAIIFGRHIPGMRIPITVFAAISGIRYRTFILSTLVSTLLWIWIYLAIGKRYGGTLAHLLGRSVGVTVAVIAGLVLISVGLHIYRRYLSKNAGRNDLF